MQSLQPYSCWRTCSKKIGQTLLFFVCKNQMRVKVCVFTMWAVERQKVSRPLSLSKLKNSSEQSASSGLFMSHRTLFTEETSAEFANSAEICLAISVGVVSHLFPSFTSPPSPIVTLVVKFTRMFKIKKHYFNPSSYASIYFTWSGRAAETESPRAASLGTPRRAWCASRWRLRYKPRPWDDHPPSFDLDLDFGLGGVQKMTKQRKGDNESRRGTILWHFTKVY